MGILLVPVFIFLEIFVFIQLGDEIGYGWAFLGLAISFFLGLNLFRFAGGQGARSMIQSMAAAGNQSPGQMGSVLAKIVAAVLLIIPGYLSDILALLLLFPPTRSLLMLYIMRRAMKSRHFQFQMNGFQTGGFGQNPFQQRNDEDVIEGEATEVKSEKSGIEKKD